MPQIGPAEIVVVLLIALLVFGPHKLPEVGRQVGRGLRELRKFQDAVKGEIDQVMTGISADDDSVADAVTPSRPAGPLPAPAPRPRPAARPRPVPARAGAHAPSRFRSTAGTASRTSRPAPPLPPRAAAPVAPSTARGAPARAPSRFRAPQR